MRQRLAAKPWLEKGIAGEWPGTGVSSIPAAKFGLGVLLATLLVSLPLFLVLDRGRLLTGAVERGPA